MMNMGHDSWQALRRKLGRSGNLARCWYPPSWAGDSSGEGALEMKIAMTTTLLPVTHYSVSLLQMRFESMTDRSVTIVGNWKDRSGFVYDAAELAALSEELAVSGRVVISFLGQLNDDRRHSSIGYVPPLTCIERTHAGSTKGSSPGV